MALRIEALLAQRRFQGRNLPIAGAVEEAIRRYQQTGMVTEFLRTRRERHRRLVELGERHLADLERRWAHYRSLVEAQGRDGNRSASERSSASTEDRAMDRIVRRLADDTRRQLNEALRRRIETRHFGGSITVRSHWRVLPSGRRIRIMSFSRRIDSR